MSESEAEGGGGWYGRLDDGHGAGGDTSQSVGDMACSCPLTCARAEWAARGGGGKWQVGLGWKKKEKRKGAAQEGEILFLFPGCWCLDFCFEFDLEFRNWS